ncbi:prepilin-type N-terminal cleavage/methylation domain-containing protein [Niallia taxi]|uniref:prepilin-type N-terminal cleavage/methylation domain-containing protein n=1 Tax=Niallia taxi TaxID=2499688 RepID=UPI003D295A2A
MGQLLKKHIKNEKGLTLIELLAVIVILGIIAAIAIPSIANIIEKSRFDAIKADAVQILNGAQTYISANDYQTGELTGTELGNYVQNVTTFPDGYKVVVASNGALTFTGAGSKGNVKVTITGATLKQINETKKASSGNTTAIPNTTTTP